MSQRNSSRKRIILMIIAHLHVGGIVIDTKHDQVEISELQLLYNSIQLKDNGEAKVTLLEARDPKGVQPFVDSFHLTHFLFTILELQKKL